jgi:hypothetical protein
VACGDGVDGRLRRRAREGRLRGLRALGLGVGWGEGEHGDAGIVVDGVFEELASYLQG